MRELNRVLRNDGVVYITAPVYDIDVTLEDSSYNTPELRKKYYDQEDHVRKYGKDFIRRLMDAGFAVEIVNPYYIFSKLDYGLQPREYIYKLIK